MTKTALWTLMCLTSLSRVPLGQLSSSTGIATWTIRWRSKCSICRRNSWTRPTLCTKSPSGTCISRWPRMIRCKFWQTRPQQHPRIGSLSTAWAKRISRTMLPAQPWQTSSTRTTTCTTCILKIRTRRARSKSKSRLQASTRTAQSRSTMARLVLQLWSSQRPERSLYPSLIETD